MYRKLIPAIVFPLLPLASPAEVGWTNSDYNYDFTVHGSVQSDMLISEKDYKIGATEYDSKFLMNDYANVGLYSKYVDAGVRVEYMEHPLPGFERDFKGWGVPNFYVKGRYKGLELTAGDFYEQFGSGFILRTYEERSLGVDNSIRGGRIKANVIPGVKLTALGGVQRRFWNWNMRSRVFGADAEFALQDWIKPLAKHDVTWTLGASYVLRNEDDENITVLHQFPGADKPELCRLNLPKNVSAIDARTHFYKSGLDLQGEFAWKGADPSYDNGYIYNKGTAYMLTASYSQHGWSLMGQAKRSENMSFRSRRSMSLSSAFLNNMPAFAYQHTYALAAMYPYATQFAPGEWAFQVAGAYHFKRKTALGGKYGTKIKANFSYITGLKRKDAVPGTVFNDPMWKGMEREKTDFFGWGEVYYRDLNVQLEKKILSWFQLNLMYMNQRYNKTQIEGHGGMVKSNIYIGDAKFRLNDRFTLRTEVQYLQTKQDRGDWCYALAELSVLPYLMFTVSDQWNHGDGPQDAIDKKAGLDTHPHYYLFGVTGTYKANRLMVSYGRTRAGYNCSGGVCRYVPASRGVSISYSYTF